MPSLPVVPTSVYRYFDAKGVLLYVGITSRGVQRQREHNSDKEWWPFVARQEVEHYPSRYTAEREEQRLIRSHKPPFNVKHNYRHQEARALYLSTGTRKKRSRTSTFRAKKRGHLSPEAKALFTLRQGRLPLQLLRDEAYIADPSDLVLLRELDIEYPVIVLNGKKVGVVEKMVEHQETIHFPVAKIKAGVLPDVAVLQVKMQNNPCRFVAHQINKATA